MVSQCRLRPDTVPCRSYHAFVHAFIEYGYQQRQIEYLSLLHFRAWFCTNCQYACSVVIRHYDDGHCLYASKYNVDFCVAVLCLPAYGLPSVVFYQRYRALCRGRFCRYDSSLSCYCIHFYTVVAIDLQNSHSSHTLLCYHAHGTSTDTFRV